jgi:nucleotide-binding universal stress UspA family protein
MSDGAPRVRLGEPIVRIGEPWRLILEVADALNVSLIVIGSHGYQGLDRVLGTTAARVVNSAKRNVLVVHAGPMIPVQAIGLPGPGQP